MGDTLVELLPYLPGIPFAAALAIMYRLWGSTARDLRVERADHRHTQGELDAERDLRRKAEDKVDELTHEMRALRLEVRTLKADVARLRVQLGEAT